MNKWDATFGSIAFLGGYLCSTYQAPWLLSLIIASGIGVTWALVSGLYDWRRGLLRISRRPKWERDLDKSLDEQVDEAIHDMEKNCRRYRRDSR